MAPRVFVAIDLGASRGRVIAGVVDGDDVQLETVSRFDNQLVERDGHLRWDTARLHREVLGGLSEVPDAESIGIDTWGVDYGLLDESGALLAEPIAYRDDRTTKIVDDVHALVPPEELYAITGVQFLPFNTIYQLAVEQRGPLWSRAAQAMLLPDLFAFWLTGEQRSELTNASTTGLLDVHTGRWSASLLDRMGFPPDLFPAVEVPGAIRGRTASGVSVTTVGSHDTASAVAGVPATTDRFAYVCCGTWSLVGLELDRPVLSEEARRANFTNEAGLDGRIRFLRNVGGLWLLQECLRDWGNLDLRDLLAAAEARGPGGPVVAVDDAAFIGPGRMSSRLAEAVGAAMTPSETVRCVLDSLATAFGRTVREAARLAGSGVDVIHLVGGGSEIELLCRLTAAAAGIPVVAGPVEATALGNVIVQARAHGALPSSLEAIRAGISTSGDLRRYDPA
jgi:rhamnulokinase